jgi:hypothetical protein
MTSKAPLEEAKAVAGERAVDILRRLKSQSFMHRK